jgi:hypothetical protein
VQAEDIVSLLLEDSLEEAAAKYLRVFGPEIPDKGYFFSGNYPAAHFIQQEVKDADFKNVSLDDYVAKFVRLGYTFVFSDGKNITVQTNQKSINFGHEAINAMEQSLGLTPDSQATWNGQTKPAAHVFYGQPDHKGPQTQQTQQQKTANAAQTKNLTLMASFGTVAGPAGNVVAVKRASTREIERGVKSGFAYVLKYPQGTYSVVTPYGFKFTPQMIKTLEAQLGITPDTELWWFSGSITQHQESNAQEAIYGV